MGTAIQDLIEVVRKRRDFMEDEGYKEAMQDVLLIALNLIKTEKEQIKSAYHEGFFDGRRWSDKQLGAKVDLFYKNGHDYYVKTFKSGE